MKIKTYFCCVAAFPSVLDFSHFIKQIKCQSTCWPVRGCRDDGYKHR